MLMRRSTLRRAIAESIQPRHGGRDESTISQLIRQPFLKHGTRLMRFQSQRLPGLLREFLTSRNCSVWLVNVEIEGSRGDTTLTSQTERYNRGGNSRSRKLNSFASANSGCIATVEIFFSQGGSSGGKRVSEHLEESPFLPARPSKPKSCDVLRVEAVPSKGCRGETGWRQEQKLASLWRTFVSLLLLNIQQLL